jgi:hypothetical protein
VSTAGRARQEKDLSFLHIIHTGSGAKAASYPIITRGPFLGGKGQGREADNSPAPSVAVKNGAAIPTIPCYVLVA